jgi:hypothetical protein
MFATAKVFMQSFRYEPELDAKGENIYSEDGTQKFYLAQENPVTSNTMIFPGRKQLGLLLTSLASGGFSWVMAGSSTVAIDTVNDDRLGGYVASATPAFEYIANGVRKQLQSTQFGGNLTAADWTASNFTDGLGNVYRWQCQAVVTYGPGDANGTVGGVPLQRYGFNTASPTPATVAGISGIAFNEMIDTSSQNLTNANQVQVKFIIRI